MRDRRKRLLSVERRLQCDDIGTRQKAAYRCKTITFVNVCRGGAVIVFVYIDMRILTARFLHLNAQTRLIGDIGTEAGTITACVDPACQRGQLRLREWSIGHIAFATVRTDLGGCVVTHYCLLIRTTGQGKHTDRRQEQRNTRSHRSPMKRLDSSSAVRSICPLRTC